MNPLAEQYQKTYQIAFGKLSKAFQDRVLACKADNAIVDPDVDEWIAGVIEQAEAKYDTKQPDSVAAPANPVVKPE
jgi:hypothetical protein